MCRFCVIFKGDCADYVYDGCLDKKPKDREGFGWAVIHAMKEATVTIEKTGEKITLAKGVEKVLWEWLEHPYDARERIRGEG